MQRRKRYSEKNNHKALRLSNTTLNFVQKHYCKGHELSRTRLVLGLQVVVQHEVLQPRHLDYRTEYDTIYKE